LAETDTELRLHNWRSGSTEAERLASALLHLEGYQNIEPQAPLGGPDETKDILCDRGGRGWVGAVYFPPLSKSFRSIKAKFLSDLTGVKRHGRQGIVFLTNQRLRASERQALRAAALNEECECEVYDVERIRGLLDVPEGYGVRIAYLRIAMTIEEQLAFFALRENVVEGAMERNTTEIRRLAVQVAGLQAAQRVVSETFASVAALAGLGANLPSPRTIDPLALGDLGVEPGMQSVSRQLSPELILLVHRLVGFELPTRMIGRYRSQAVHLGTAGSHAAATVMTPPPASQVPDLVRGLCDRWQREYEELGGHADRLAAMARFHHEFLSIHPFLDGNGRVARALLLQQCLDLFGRANMSRFDRGVSYNDALIAANAGIPQPLENLIRPVVSD
jgi:hypothetical protein